MVAVAAPGNLPRCLASVAALCLAGVADLECLAMPVGNCADLRPIFRGAETLVSACKRLSGMDYGGQLWMGTQRVRNSITCGASALTSIESV